MENLLASFAFPHLHSFCPPCSPRSEEMDYIRWSAYPRVFGVSRLIDSSFGTGRLWHPSSASPATNWPLVSVVSIVDVVGIVSIVSIVVVVVTAGSV